MMHDLMLIVGFGCVVAGASMWSIPLGLVVFGVPLVVLAIAKRRESSVDS